VYEPTLVDFGQRRRDANSKAQEGPRVHRCIEETVEGRVAGIFGKDRSFAHAEPRSAIHIEFDLVHGMPVHSGACPSRELPVDDALRSDGLCTPRKRWKAARGRLALIERLRSTSLQLSKQYQRIQDISYPDKPIRLAQPTVVVEKW